VPVDRDLRLSHTRPARHLRAITAEAGAPAGCGGAAAGAAVAVAVAVLVLVLVLLLLQLLLLDTGHPARYAVSAPGRRVQEGQRANLMSLLLVRPAAPPETAAAPLGDAFIAAFPPYRD